MTATSDRAQANAEIISAIYEQFGRGDVPAILERIAPDCRWESWNVTHFGQRGGLPTQQQRSGPDGVAEFFGRVAELEMHDFQVLDVLAGERQVVVEVVIEYTTPAGGRLRDEELHLWTLDERGQIARMRHYVDTAKHLAAFAGEDTTAG
jgi:ketosteroid isomerase-like protein